MSLRLFIIGFDGFVPGTIGNELSPAPNHSNSNEPKNVGAFNIALRDYFVKVETGPVAAENNENPGDCIIVRYCDEKPDRVFLVVPPKRKDWIAFSNPTPGKWWHSQEKLWNVPRTEELFKAFRGLCDSKSAIKD